MSVPRITVVVLTYNRPHTLRQTLDSIIAQDFDDFAVLVMDNCSTDGTPQLVQQYMQRDPRIRYHRNEQNLGIIRNWNRGLSLNPSPFVSVFHDDDLMLVGFLRETIAALEKHPSAAFVLTQAQFIGDNNEPKDEQDVGEIRDGLMPGLDLLELWADGRGGWIFPPTIVMRDSAVREAGFLESNHMRGYADMDFYYRMAARHDVVFLRKQLVQYRVHEGSDTELLNRQAGGTPWYGEMSSRLDALAPLLRSKRAEDPQYRNWLADRLLYLHRNASAAIHPSLPAMYHPWETRVELAAELLDRSIPAGESFILVDDAQLGFHGTWRDRRIIPFLERDGEYFGPPTDDQQALAELDRLRQSGIHWLAIAWPCFWWLDRYWRFGQHVDRTFARRVDSPHVVVYEMQ